MVDRFSRSLLILRGTAFTWPTLWCHSSFSLSECLWLLSIRYEPPDFSRKCDWFSRANYWASVLNLLRNWVIMDLTLLNTQVGWCYWCWECATFVIPESNEPGRSFMEGSCECWNFFFLAFFFKVTCYSFPSHMGNTLACWQPLGILMI